MVKDVKQILEHASKDDLIELFTALAMKNEHSVNTITIEELCIKQIQYGNAKEFSEKTINQYKAAHKYIQQYCKNKGIEYADEITIDHAEEYYNFLMKHKGFQKKDGTLSKMYIIGMYKMTKSMFAYAEKRDHIIKNPFENKVYPQSQVTEWWTDEYVKKLIEAIDKHGRTEYSRFTTKLKVLLTYTTGLRSGIIHRIRRKDVILEEDEVFVNTKCKVPKSAEIQRITTPIMNKRVKTMMREHIKELDKKGIKPEQYIFTKKGNDPKSGYQNYRKILIRVCKKDGLPYMKSHGAKHGFITKMAIHGLNSEQICKLTGNRTPELIRKVYMHLQLKDVKEKAREVIENI